MNKNIVQPIFTEKVVEFIDGLISKARIKIAGNYEEYDVFETIIKKNVITKYLYLEDTQGVITEAQLLTKDNEVLTIKDYNIKETLDGIVLTFRFEIDINEIKLGWIDKIQEGGEYWNAEE